MNKEQLKDFELEIVTMYNNYIPVKQIALKYETTIYTIYDILNKHKEIITKQKFVRLNQGNQDYFDLIDSNIKAYFLGFIAADGALIDSKKGATIQLTITLHRKDIILLEKLKSELQHESKIQSIIRYHKQWGNITDHVRFAIANKTIANSLMKHGIQPRKSLTMENIIQNIPKEFRNSFILGYFDGDGSFCSYLTTGEKGPKTSLKKTVSIRGTKEFLLGICKELDIQSFSISERDAIASLNICSEKEVKNFFKIYNNNSFYLERKYNKFMEYFNTINYNPLN